jgi:hypothetical protein
MKKMQLTLALFKPDISLNEKSLEVKLISSF